MNVKTNFQMSKNRTISVRAVVLLFTFFRVLSKFRRLLVTLGDLINK